MTNLTLTDDDVEAMIEAAFAVLAKRHPEAKSGDYPPDASLMLTEDMRRHALYWLDLNTPEDVVFPDQAR